ncbi:hypothetical protein [Kineococcus glutinatus]|uniref:Ribosomally synthesized peptide with SipW-like signal peptide n=1 Tax=Kineococcus glutinatus TaxID=1070872 RepID=A0ABP9I1E6_9ACTN
MPSPKSERRRRAAAIAAVPVGLLASGLIVHSSSNAAFTATTSTGTNTWTAGTVALTNSSPSASLPWSSNGSGALKPGTSETKCVVVTYSGSLAANIALYASGYATTAGSSGGAAGTNLEDQLQFTIDYKTGGDFTSTCGSFTASTPAMTLPVTNEAAKAFGARTAYSAGASVSNVASNTIITYRVSYTLSGSATDYAQGDSVAFNFTWQAQNT